MKFHRKSVIVTCLVLSVLVFLSCLIPPHALTIRASAAADTMTLFEVNRPCAAAEDGTEPTETEVPTEPTVMYYTEVDAVIVAKLLWEECRGVSGTYKGVSAKARQAAVAWTVVDRLDAGTFGDTLVAVVTAPNQFAYNPNAPVNEELLWLANDVLSRWNREKNGETDVGRTIPAEYLYFYGDGKENHFRIGYKDADTWDWSLPDPYQNTDQ